MQVRPHLRAQLHSNASGCGRPVDAVVRGAALVRPVAHGLPQAQHPLHRQGGHLAQPLRPCTAGARARSGTSAAGALATGRQQKTYKDYSLRV